MVRAGKPVLKPCGGRAAGLLDVLDEWQRAAALAGERYVIVEAGPGAGKTATLAARAALMVERGESPVVALAFTRRAAAELAARLPDRAVVTTLHAFALRILRSEAMLAGEEPPRLAGPDEQAAILERSKRLAGRNRSSGDGAFVEGGPESGKSGEPGGEARRLYRAELSSRGLIDFDGLVDGAAQRLKRDAGASRRWAGACRHLLVDEFQDLDASQVELLRLLVSPGDSSLFAIGDGDQSIYSFRGADASLFRDFETIFPGARRYRLRHCYRCPAELLEPARAVLAGDGGPAGPVQRSSRGHEEASREAAGGPAGGGTSSGSSSEGRSANGRASSGFAGETAPATVRARTGGDTFTAVRSGGAQAAPRLLIAHDRGVEAAMVVKEIESLVGGLSMESGEGDGGREEEAMEGVAFGDIAVLFRLHRLADGLCAALEKAGIPLRRRGGRGWVDERPVRQVLALLELALDESCDTAAHTVLSLPGGRGLSRRARDLVDARAAADGVPALQALRLLLDESSLPGPAQARRATSLLAFLAGIRSRCVSDGGAAGRAGCAGPAEGPPAAVTAASAAGIRSRCVSDGGAAGRRIIASPVARSRPGGAAGRTSPDDTFRTQGRDGAKCTVGDGAEKGSVDVQVVVDGCLGAVYGCGTRNGDGAASAAEDPARAPGDRLLAEGTPGPDGRDDALDDSGGPRGGGKFIDALLDYVIAWLPPALMRGAGPEAAMRRLREQYAFWPPLTPAASVRRLLDECRCIREGEWLDADADAVTVSTFHSAKGLEFPVVFLCGLEDGIVPCEGADVCEERRLMYVAMTRASKRLYLSCPPGAAQADPGLPDDRLQQGDDCRGHSAAARPSSGEGPSGGCRSAGKGAAQARSAHRHSSGGGDEDGKGREEGGTGRASGQPVAGPGGGPVMSPFVAGLDRKLVLVPEGAAAREAARAEARRRRRRARTGRPKQLSLF